MPGSIRKHCILVTAFLAAAALSACASGDPPPPASGPWQAPSPRPAPPPPAGQPAASPQPTGQATAPPPSAIAAPPPSASARPEKAASSGACPADMVDTKTACIDRFEAPNVQGEKPVTMFTAPEAEEWCKQKGKRLCTEDEWDRACEGPEHLRYPYGKAFKEGVCNDDAKKYIVPSWAKLATWPSEAAKAEVARLDQRDPSGKRSGCVSAEGVSDLTGNVAEWVKRTRPNPTNYEHVVKGCFWGKCFREPHEPACDYVNYNHPSGFRSYELGFRCCQDRPKG